MFLSNIRSNDLLRRTFMLLYPSFFLFLKNNLNNSSARNNTTSGKCKHIPPLSAQCVVLRATVVGRGHFNKLLYEDFEVNIEQRVVRSE